MLKWTRPVALVLVLSAITLSCGGGGHGSGPTDPPTPTGKRFRFEVTANSAVLQGGLQEAAIFFDGREVGRTDFSRAGGSCQFLCSTAATVDGSLGSHTVRFTAVRQTRATVDYLVTVNGILTDLQSGSQEAVNSPSQRARLSAGGSMDFTIRF